MGIDISGFTSYAYKQLDQFKVDAFNILKETTREVSARRYPEIKEKVVDEYKKAIDNFYKEGVTLYDRKHSLYNLILVKYDLDTTDFRYFFDDSKLTKMRKGGLLYDLVFEEGWHGGAKSGDETHYANGLVVHTPHPNTGTPYYRKPHPYYRYWGEPAKKAPVSPHEESETNIEKLLDDEFEKIFKEVSQVMDKKISNI